MNFRFLWKNSLNDSFLRFALNKLAMEINPLLSEVMQPGFQIVVHMKTTSN